MIALWLSAAIMTFCLPLLVGARSWEPKISIEDSIRWSKLDFLSQYDIVSAAKGLSHDIWFVHQSGLLHYDGKDLESFPIDKDQLRGLLDVFVTSRGEVCILTISNLVVWHGGTYTVHSGFENEIIRRNSIVEGADQRIYVSTDSGLFALRGENFVPVDLDGRRPASILVDHKGLLWVVDADSREIAVYEIDEVPAAPILRQVYNFPGPVGNTLPQQLFEDSQRRVWAFDREELKSLWYFEDYRKVVPLDALNITEPTGVYAALAEIQSGELWFATTQQLIRMRGNQLTSYDNSSLPFPTTFPYLLSLSNNRLLLGGVGYTPRIINLSTQEWLTYEGLNFQCEDDQGTEWFIAEKHEIVSQSNGIWRKYTVDDGLIDCPNRLMLASDGSLWASGAHQGFAAVAAYLDGKWTTYAFPEVAKVFSHLAAIETSDGALIFGAGTPIRQLGDGRGGGVVFRKKGNTFEHLNVPPPSFLVRTSTMVERVNYGLMLGSGNLFRTGPTGLYAAQRYDEIFHRWIDHMMVDQANDVWIACSGVGVYQYDGESFRLYGTADGLRDKNVIFLVEDQKRGGILALAEAGFHRFDGLAWSRWGSIPRNSYKRENHTVFQDRSGALWINSASRSWFLDGQMSLGPNYTFQAVRYNPETDPPDTGVSMVDSNFPEGSQVQINFSGADFWAATPEADLEYSWRLNGGAWSVPAAKPDVTLHNLREGHYQVQVRARDRSGNMDETPAQISFGIYLPVWKKGWFIFLVVATMALLALLIYLLVRVRIKAALAIDEFKLDFFTNISHELRNPLAVILSPAELLLKSETEESRRQKLQMIIRNAHKLQAMVDQLLKFRSVEKGNWIQHPVGGEIVSFIRDTVYNFEPLWKEKEQQLEFTFEPESHLCSFDSDTIRQTVDNLLSNAIKYSGPGTRLRVSVKVDHSAPHQTLILSVADEGSGIPPHEQENVLEPFYRIKHKVEQEGSGVGLALVKQLVKRSGGKISIQSPVTEGGRGTCFTVSLPLEPYGESEAPDIDEGPAEQEDDRPLLLIVEDNEDLRHILTDAFMEHYHIAVAKDGLDGFEQALHRNPDVVVSDIMMPGMDGFGLCEKLKADPETSHIPVILLTAKNSDEHRLRGIKAGADDYLFKPLQLDHLQARIENLLESRRELKRRFARQLLVEPTEITVTSTDELILRRAITVVEEHMQDEDFDVNSFSRLMAMSVASLRRKLKAVTGQTPLAFIQKLRVKRAAQLLAATDLPVADIGARVGIYDQSYFGKLFRKEMGVAPSGYKDYQLRKNKPTT